MQRLRSSAAARPGQAPMGILPMALLERAGLYRMRGDADGMARDLTEARRLFAQMGATGWDDYARTIEA